MLVFATATLVAGSSSTDARYTPAVREARQWAREHTDDRHFRCLHILWMRESGWHVHARYPRNAPLSRAAYGIPQFFPGTKLHRRARHSALLQVQAGLRYIRSRWNGACRALRHSYRFQWY